MNSKCGSVRGTADLWSSFPILLEVYSLNPNSPAKDPHLLFPLVFFSIRFVNGSRYHFHFCFFKCRIWYLHSLQCRLHILVTIQVVAYSYSMSSHVDCYYELTHLLLFGKSLSGPSIIFSDYRLPLSRQCFCLSVPVPVCRVRSLD